ncbi:hypothetical protein [Paenibacillus xylanivorans]|uniref:hypothetical protein n=1 Tax=Paenibacillus xylanivorans TaxID=1705561 RepID=UPI00191C1CEB|nr:hypothetical protein [Paenibacillus xylanivorans]
MRRIKDGTIGRIRFYLAIHPEFRRSLCENEVGELHPLLRRSNSEYAIGERVVCTRTALSALSEQQFAVVLVSTGGYAAAGLWVCHHIRDCSTCQ